MRKYIIHDIKEVRKKPWCLTGIIAQNLHQACWFQLDPCSSSAIRAVDINRGASAATQVAH